MERGSTDNISLIIVGLNDPTEKKQPKKGNQHIKILNSLNCGNKKRASTINNKQNDYPEKMKQIDAKILEINRNATKILQQGRR